MSWYAPAWFIVWLVPLMVVNAVMGWRINRRIGYAIGRMVVQLGLVGIFLQFVFQLNNPWLNVGYVLFMTLVANVSAIRSASLGGKGLFFPIWASFALPQFAVLLFFTGIVLTLDSPLEPRFLIPIGGMLLGNSMTGNIIGLKTYFGALSTRRREYEYSLGMGASLFEARRPFITESVLASVNPMIASIETIGLVALPGMMTGQILGGALPVTAIIYQIAIMLGILVARFFAILLAIFFTSRSAFDAFGMLRADWS